MNTPKRKQTDAAKALSLLWIAGALLSMATAAAVTAVIVAPPEAAEPANHSDRIQQAGGVLIWPPCREPS